MSETTDKKIRVSWASARGRVEERTVTAAYHQQADDLVNLKRANGEVVLTVKASLIEAIEPLDNTAAA